MKKVLTGIKPTGEIHLGNYFAVIADILELQKKNTEIFLFIADLHTLADSTIDIKQTHKKTDELVKSFVALGINPKKTIIYRQSDFPQLTELMWVLFSITTFPHLQRSHAYKSAVASKKIPTLALSIYPVLMASDILLPDFDIIPVGRDQLQHIEYTREWARKFNKQFGKYFKEPNVFVKDDIEIMGIDGRKMSKSYKNTLPIFADKEIIQKKIAAIKTDSKGRGEKLNPDNCNIFYFYDLLTNDSSSLREKYLSGSVGYKEAKNELLNVFMNKFDDSRKKYNKIIKDANFTEKILSKNRKKINKLLDRRLHEIKILVGLRKK